MYLLQLSYESDLYITRLTQLLTKLYVPLFCKKMRISIQDKTISAKFALQLLLASKSPAFPQLHFAWTEGAAIEYIKSDGIETGPPEQAFLF